MRCSNSQLPSLCQTDLFQTKESFDFSFSGSTKHCEGNRINIQAKSNRGEKGINYEKKLDLKIQSAVLDLLGPHVFRDSSEHYFQHSIGAESDHLSSLERLTVKKYLSLRLNSYGKRYTEMVIHGNVPSVRHTLMKAIIFKNQ